MLQSQNHYWLLVLIFVIIGQIGCTSTHTLSPLLETIQRIPLKTIQVDGDRIVYTETGSGRLLILLHGFGGSIWNWEHQQTNLSSHYRVITLDLLGSGRSAKPDIIYTPSRLVTFFLHFMDALGIENATLVGNSMGAGLAMATALTAPDRVKALVLIDGLPPTLTDTIQSPLYKRFLIHRPPLWLAKIGNWMSGRWTTRKILEEITYDHSLLTPLVIERSFQNRNRGDLFSPLYSLMERMDEWKEQYGKRMGEIRQPTLILWGEEDRVFPPAVGEKIRDLLPHATWKLIPQGGHFLQWEKPQQVNALLLDFLAAHNL